MIAGTDTLLQGLTNQALDGFLGKGAYAVDVTCNWYFMAASTFLVALVLGYASQKSWNPGSLPMKPENWKPYRI
jgi:aminobenzoyl-glutamate transport protein